MRKALVLSLLCTVGACNKSEREAAPMAVEQPSAAPTQLPKPPSYELAAKLDAIMRKPDDFATGVDKSGTKTVTYSLKPIDGIGMAGFVGVRGQQKAWRFALEGMRCDRINELGVEVALLQSGDGRPLSASWYRVKGGPLEGLLVKVFPGDGPGLCNVMPGTPPYWGHQGEKPPGE